MNKFFGTVVGAIVAAGALSFSGAWAAEVVKTNGNNVDRTDRTERMERMERTDRVDNGTCGTYDSYDNCGASCGSCDCCEQEEGIFISFDALLWKACRSDMDYALRGDTLSPDIIEGGAMHSMDFSWQLGFRVGLGYRLPCSRFDIRLEYTRFHSSAKGSVEDVVGTQPELYATRVHPAAVGTAQIASASAKMDLKYDDVVFEVHLGRGASNLTSADSSRMNAGSVQLGLNIGNILNGVFRIGVEAGVLQTDVKAGAGHAVAEANAEAKLPAEVHGVHHTSFDNIRGGRITTHRVVQVATAGFPY